MTACVLVIDDEKNIRRTLRMVLEGEGYEVDEAGTVLWRLDLAPREQRTVRFRFQVDHPSDLVVSGL